MKEGFPSKGESKVLAHEIERTSKPLFESHLARMALIPLPPPAAAPRQAPIVSCRARRPTSARAKRSRGHTRAGARRAGGEKQAEQSLSRKARRGTLTLAHIGLWRESLTLANIVFGEGETHKLANIVIEVGETDSGKHCFFRERR